MNKRNLNNSSKHSYLILTEGQRGPINPIPYLVILGKIENQGTSQTLNKPIGFLMILYALLCLLTKRKAYLNSLSLDSFPSERKFLIKIKIKTDVDILR